MDNTQNVGCGMIGFGCLLTICAMMLPFIAGTVAWLLN